MKCLLQVLDAEIDAGRNRQALELIEATDRHIAGSTDIQLKHGVILRNLGRYQESVDILFELNSNSPNDIHILHQLAISQHLTGDMDASDAALDAVLTLHPGHADILLGKIHNAERLGDAKRTLDRARHALALHPNNINFALIYVNALRNGGLASESQKYFESLLPRHHNKIEVCLELARIRLSQKRLASARTLIDKVLRTDLLHHGGILLGIECALLSGRMMHAIQLAQRAFQRVGRDPSAAIALARLYRTAERPELAIDILDGLTDESNETPEAQLIRADSFADLGLIKQAYRLYHCVLSKNPGDSNAILKTLEIALGRHGEESPTSILDKLVSGEAPFGTASRPALLILQASAQAGAWERLLEHCSSLSAEPSARKDIHAYFIALAHFGLGNPQAAKASLSEFLRAHPDDFRGNMLLADIELAVGKREASFEARSKVATAKGLPQQSALLLHALDLLRTGALDAANKCFAALKNMDGYLPTPAYIHEILRQGGNQESAACSEKAESIYQSAQPPRRSALPGATAVPSPAIGEEGFIDSARLERLFDFDSECRLFGGEIHPPALLAWSLTQGAYGDFPGWYRRVLQSMRTNRALLLTPARAENLEKFMAPLDSVAINELFQEGRSLILASSPHGPRRCRDLSDAGKYPTSSISRTCRRQNHPGCLALRESP